MLPSECARILCEVFDIRVEESERIDLRQKLGAERIVCCAERFGGRDAPRRVRPIPGRDGARPSRRLRPAVGMDAQPRHATVVAASSKTRKAVNIRAGMASPEAHVHTAGHDVAGEPFGGDARPACGGTSIREAMTTKGTTAASNIGMMRFMALLYVG